MRIVGGRHRGRRILAPPGDAVRPTSDRAREALFNILAHGKYAAAGPPFAEARILDAFAGTGAVGLEALSRGAAAAFFMERGAAALAALRRNVEVLGEAARASILAVDATRPPRTTEPCALVFLDPPYESALAAPALAALAEAGWLDAGALAIVELGVREAFAPPAAFNLIEERVYGAARLVFLLTP